MTHNSYELLDGQHPVVILRNAKQLITHRSNWSRFNRAEDAFGRRVHPTSEAAVRWDIEGAIAVCCNGFGVLPPLFVRLLDKAAFELFGLDGLYDVSHLGHEAELLILGKAIELLENCC